MLQVKQNNKQRISLLSQQTLINSFVKQTKTTIFPLQIKNTKVNNLKCILFNLDEYPNKIDKVYFETYFGTMRMAKEFGGRNALIKLSDFENNVPTPEQATYGSLARNDINFTADFELNFMHKNATSKIEIEEVCEKGNVEKLIDNFFNAVNSDNWFLYKPLFLRSRKSLDEHNRFWQNESALRQQFYRFYDDNELCRPRFQTSEEAKQYVFETPTHFGTNKESA